MKKYSKHVFEKKDETVTLNVVISNLQPHQVEELKNLLYAMDLAGSLGCSRTFNVGVDGDGSFRPIVTIDGEGKKNFEFGKNVNFDSGKDLGFSLE